MVERLLASAKAEKDWPTIAPLKAAAVVKHPAVRAVLEAFPDAEIRAIRETAK